MKTATIQLGSIKDPDGWGNLIHELGLSEEKRRQYFQWGEYADLELEIDENLQVVSGRILPVQER
jgi:hypothetical protein